MGDGENKPCLKREFDEYKENLVNEIKLLRDHTSRGNEEERIKEQESIFELKLKVNTQYMTLRKSNRMTRAMTIINFVLIILIILGIGAYLLLERKTDRSNSIDPARVHLASGLVVDMEIRLREMGVNIEKLLSSSDGLDKRVRGLETNIDQQQKRLGDLGVQVRGMGVNIEKQATKSVAMDTRVDQLEVSVRHQLSGLHGVEKRVRQLETNMTRQQKRLGDLDVQVRDMAVNVEKRVQHLNTNISHQQKRLGDVDLQVHDMGVNIEKNNWGDIVWVIDNWAAKRDVARYGGAARIFSDPFYSHKHGYKMRLSLLLTGSVDEMNRTCVYWQLMRSQYDNILTWPFPYSVTISVINQHDRSNYASSTAEFDADRNPSGWTRPTAANRGICFGISVSLSDLSLNPALIQNDKIFIRCLVRPAPRYVPDMANHVCYELFIIFLAVLSCRARSQL